MSRDLQGDAAAQAATPPAAGEPSAKPRRDELGQRSTRRFGRIRRDRARGDKPRGSKKRGRVNRSPRTLKHRLAARPGGSEFCSAGSAPASSRSSAGSLPRTCQAGVDFTKSLSSLERQFSGTALGPILGRIQLSIRRGSTLEEAMAREPQAFGPMFLSMIKVAEARGGVPETLKMLAQHYEARQRCCGRPARP